MLTADCKGKSFSVRVRNDARDSRAFSWTRTVTLKVREGRVTLGQKMRIKFNGKRVALPFNHGTLRIYQDGYSATVETGVGVKLLWDGDSFLEVAVPHALRGRLCGLCGNFNGNKSDDFMTRRGSAVNHPSTFGQSWRVGGKKACTRPEEGMCQHFLIGYLFFLIRKTIKLTFTFSQRTRTPLQEKLED